LDVKTPTPRRARGHKISRAGGALLWERTGTMGSAFVGFLSDMSSRQINHLYQSPWACLSVLRSLPSLAKHYVMRLLYVDEGIAREEMDAWVRPGKEHRDRHARAMSALKRLRVLVPAGDQEYVADGKELVRLNRRFVKGVRAQIETCFAPEGDEVEATVAPDDAMGGKRPSPEKIEEFAKGRWEALLMTLTGRDVEQFSSKNPNPNERGGKRRRGPGLDVAALFRGAGLVAEKSNKSGAWGITEKGFRFLLSTAREQIWTLLTEYVRQYVDVAGSMEEKVAEVSIAGVHVDIGDAVSDDDDDDDDDDGDGGGGGDEKSAPGDRTLVAPAVIGFMLRLTFQAVGQPYRVDDLPLAQRAIAEDLAHLGLLYLFAGPGKEGYYVPTQLTAGLAGGGSENDPDNDDGDAPGGDSPRKAKDVADGDESLGGDAGGHIIAETNFRVYAYTFSDVECEILRLFTRPDYRLPNLYVGMLTREAVHEALDTGVAAEQIIKYIKSHAHPNARKTTNGSGIPPNVADQIMLWAMERRRVRSADCVLYCDFPTGTDEYAAAVKAASDAGVLLWEDREQMKLAVAKSGHERMKEVFKAMRMQGGSGMQGGGAAAGGGLTVAMRRK